jgi:hypothetical protein
MLLTELPKSTVVLDSETLVQMLIRKRTNRHLSIFAGLVDSFDLITLASVRSDFVSYDVNWGEDGVDHIDVRRRTQALSGTAGDMVEPCQADGIDPFNPVVARKLNLVALAKMNDACVVSVDSRDNNMSMKCLCECFGIPFIAIDEVEL